MRALLFALLAASPALAQAPRIDRQAATDRLLDALRSAPTEQAAALLEAHVVELWVGAATPAVKLLLARANREQQAGSQADAVEDFGAVLTLQPDLADVWRQRAEARYANGDARGAIADLGEALKREPRDFLAWRELARIAAARQDWKSAYDAWDRLMSFDPKTPGGAQQQKEFRRKAFGEET